MSSIANRSGGGIKLLDTVAGGTNKNLDYFSTIGSDYDLLLIVGISGNYYSEHIIAPQDSFVLLYFLYSKSEASYIDRSTSQCTFSKIGGVAVTYKIYGIQL